MSKNRRPWHIVVQQSDEVIELDDWAKRYVAFLVRHESNASDGDLIPSPRPSFRTTAGADVTLA